VTLPDLESESQRPIENFFGAANKFSDINLKALINRRRR